MNRVNPDDRPRYYILVGRRTKQVDVLTWGYWFEEHKRDDVRIVRQENVGRGWFASTVFIGLDHQWRAVGPPLIFETLITGPRRVRRELREFRDATRRYSTWTEAEDGHRALVAMLQAALAVAGGKVH